MKIKEMAELQALNNEWSSISLSIIRYFDMLPKIFPVLITPSKIDEENKYYVELTNLVTDFNELVYRTEKVFKSSQIREEVLPKSIYFSIRYEIGRNFLYEGEVSAKLQTMSKECLKVLPILTGLSAEIVLSPEKEKELETLKNEIKQKIEPILPLFASDLNLVIDSFRKADLLGSVLIAGRVVSVIISKTRNKLSKETKKEIKDIMWDYITSFLRERNVLEGDAGERILESMKLYRNKFSHNVGTYPSIEECIIVISGAVSLVKRIIENKVHLELNLG